jgi:O-antigen/teichoic acid export membrane protein
MTSERRLVVYNSFLLSFNPVLNIVVGVFFAGYIGRHLGVDRYGNFNYSLSFVSLFAFVANFGITTVLQREVAQPSADVNALFMNSVYLKSLFLLLTLVAVFLGSFAIHANPTIFHLNMILAFYVAGMSLQNSFASVFKGRSDMKPIAAVDITYQLADVAICVAVLFFGGKEIGIAYGKLGVIVLALLLYLAFLRRRVALRPVALDPSLARRFLDSGFYITLITVFYPLYHQVGPVILGASSAGPRAVGLYQAANGFVDRLLRFTQPLNDAVFPIFALSREDKGRSRDQDFYFYFKAVLILAVGAWIGTHYAGPLLIAIFFGPEYAEAQVIIRIMAIAIGLRFVNNFAGTLLLARGHDRPCALIVGANVALHVVVCLLVIPRWGAVGIAYAFVISETIGLVMRVAYVLGEKLFPTEGIVRRSFGLLLVVLAFGAFNWVHDDLPSPVASNLALIAAYPFALLAFRVIEWGDLRRLRTVFFRPSKPPETPAPHDHA